MPKSINRAFSRAYFRILSLAVMNLVGRKGPLIRPYAEGLLMAAEVMRTKEVRLPTASLQYLGTLSGAPELPHEPQALARVVEGYLRQALVLNDGLGTAFHPTPISRLTHIPSVTTLRQSALG